MLLVSTIHCDETQPTQILSSGPSQSSEKEKQVTDNCDPNSVSSVVEDTRCPRVGQEGHPGYNWWVRGSILENVAPFILLAK